MYKDLTSRCGLGKQFGLKYMGDDDEIDTTHLRLSFNLIIDESNGINITVE